MTLNSSRFKPMAAQLGLALQASAFKHIQVSTAIRALSSQPIKKFDCIVIGLGAHGSSTLYHLAKKGASVLGIEQFKVAHSLGSSHGLSRIIRLSYFEDPSYVALLRRAFTLWRELEKESGQNLLTRTGSLDIGTKDSRIFQGSKQTCEKENLNHEVLNQSQLVERFPGWNKLPKSANLSAVFQIDGGFLHPERCNEAHTKLARSHGAHVREDETVTSIEFSKSGDEVVVRTNRGGEFVASRVILSPGPWLSGFVRGSPALSRIRALDKVAKLLDTQRNVVIWYKSRVPQLYATEVFPVFVLDYEKEFYYGFPITGLESSPHEQFGFKIGKYHHRKESLSHEMLNPSAEWRVKFQDEDEQVIGKAMKDLLPDAYGPVMKQVACIFTNLPDEHFIIDSCPDPNHKALALISACSGHGFKFASVIGEIMATLVMTNDQENPSKHYKFANVDWLRAKRFI